MKYLKRLNLPLSDFVLKDNPIYEVSSESKPFTYIVFRIELLDDKKIDFCLD